MPTETALSPGSSSETPDEPSIYGPWGPWSPDIADNRTEQIAQMRSLAVLVRAYAGSDDADVVKILRWAEEDPQHMELARQRFEQLPSFTARKIIATFGAVMWTPSAARKELRKRGVR